VNGKLPHENTENMGRFKDVARVGSARTGTKRLGWFAPEGKDPKYGILGPLEATSTPQRPEKEWED